jgi:hypothetical protein
VSELEECGGGGRSRGSERKLGQQSGGWWVPGEGIKGSVHWRAWPHGEPLSAVMWWRLSMIFQRADERFPWLAQTEASQLLGLSPAFTLVSCSAYSTLKMEAICSFETSADFQWTTQCYVPEDSTLHNHRCENLRSYIPNVYFMFFSVFLFE